MVSKMKSDVNDSENHNHSKKKLTVVAKLFNLSYWNRCQVFSKGGCENESFQDAPDLNIHYDILHQHGL